MSNRAYPITMIPEPPDIESSDLIVVDYRVREFVVTTLFQWERTETFPMAVGFPTRWLEFDDDYQTVSGTAFFEGEAMGLDQDTIYFAVAPGELRATCH